MINELKVKVLNPRTCRKNIVCESCEITYHKKDYLLFYDLRKLVYFNFLAEDGSIIKICDSCLVGLASWTCAKYDLPYVYIIIKNKKNAKIKVQHEDDKQFTEELIKLLQQKK